MLLIIYTNASLHWGGKLRADRITEEYFPVILLQDTTWFSSQEQTKFSCQACGSLRSYVLTSV